MSDVTIKYKGTNIATMDASGTKTLNTSGKYCEGDVQVVYADPEKPTQSKTVTPTASGFTVFPDSGKVLSSVVVNGDNDLIAGNIRSGKNIFGVDGTLVEGITPSGNKAITATTSTQTGIDVTSYATVSVAPTPSETKSTTVNGDVTPSNGKLLSKVTVNVPTGTARSASDLTVSGATVTVPAGLYSAQATKSVEITKELLASLDADFVAENIKKDVDLFGLLGTLEAGGGGGIPEPVFSNVTVVNEGSGRAYFQYSYNHESKTALNEATLEPGSSLTKTDINCCGVRGTLYGDPISITPSDAVIYLGAFGYGGSFKYYYLYKDCTIRIVTSCFLPDTLITLADGTKKQIKDITYSDRLKVWNFDTGEYDTSPICWLTRSGYKNRHYYKLTFSDGTILKTTGRNSNHKVYNVDERYFKGVDKTEIGDRIFSENGIVTVVNKEYIEEEIEYYNLITTGTINCFAEGILTSDRYGNLYPIDENMMYIKDGRYRPYEEFEAAGIKRYWYDTLRLAEVSGTIEETQQYIAKLECQMLPLPEDKLWRSTVGGNVWAQGVYGREEYVE